MSEMTLKNKTTSWNKENKMGIILFSSLMFDVSLQRNFENGPSQMINLEHKL